MTPSSELKLISRLWPRLSRRSRELALRFVVNLQAGEAEAMLIRYGYAPPREEGGELPLTAPARPQAAANDVWPWPAWGGYWTRKR